MLWTSINSWVVEAGFAGGMMAIAKVYDPALPQFEMMAAD